MNTIDTILCHEREARKSGKWLMFANAVLADDGTAVYVVIKSFGFYNQRFTVNSSIDYQSGHTINTVKAMHKHIRDTINNHSTIQRKIT